MTEMTDAAEPVSDTPDIADVDPAPAVDEVAPPESWAEDEVVDVTPPADAAEPVAEALPDPFMWEQPPAPEALNEPEVAQAPEAAAELSAGDDQLSDQPADQPTEDELPVEAPEQPVPPVEQADSEPAPESSAEDEDVDATPPADAAEPVAEALPDPSTWEQPAAPEALDEPEATPAPDAAAEPSPPGSWGEDEVVDVTPPADAVGPVAEVLPGSSTWEQPAEPDALSEPDALNEPEAAEATVAATELSAGDDQLSDQPADLLTEDELPVEAPEQPLPPLEQPVPAVGQPDSQGMTDEPFPGSGHADQPPPTLDTSAEDSSGPPLSDVLGFEPTSKTTDVGTAFFDDADPVSKTTDQVPEYPGEYVLDLHGSPDAVEIPGDDGGKHLMSPTEFAGVLKNGSGWNGEPIRLFSCETGQDPNGFAQQLANELGVSVTAPTESVWTTGNGSEPVVSAGEPQLIGGDWIDVPIDPPTGEWKTFTPNGQGES